MHPKRFLRIKRAKFSMSAVFALEKNWEAREMSIEFFLSLLLDENFGSDQWNGWGNVFS